MNKILIIILAGTLCASGFGCVTSGHMSNRRLPHIDRVNTPGTRVYVDHRSNW